MGSTVASRLRTKLQSVLMRTNVSVTIAATMDSIAYLWEFRWFRLHPLLRYGSVDEAQETCDGADCRESCEDLGLALRPRQLKPAMSRVSRLPCAPGDGVCCEGCSSVNDGDCTATCGNGILEAGEVCDDGFTDSCGTCNTDCPHWHGCRMGMAIDVTNLKPVTMATRMHVGPAMRTARPRVAVVCGDGERCPEFEP